ncbi:MAG TPA: thioredoxin domain-containing protein [Pyrinomonadaceae bacterium]|nr:thioredoxin domain-containing protein [Pyrinomonadaceae bacterium]
MKRFAPVLIIVIVFAAAVIAGFWLFRAGPKRDPLPGGPSASPTTPVAANVVVTLEEFGDYQCPPCAELHPTLKKLKQEFGSSLNFVFRNLPLSTIHKNALPAARAAEAARMQNRFWEMHDLLYENQSQWAEAQHPGPIFLNFARGLGLDLERFERDQDDKQVQLRIEADQDAAARLGIDGTPTILIEGRKLRVEATNPDGIRKGIEVMMTRKNSPAS